MRAVLGSVLLAPVFLAASAAAQSAPPNREGAWRVGFTVGTSTFNGASTGSDDSGADLVFRPYRPTMLGLALSHGRDRLRIILSGKYGQPGLGFRGTPEDADSPSLLVVAENAFHLASFGASIGTRLVRLREGPALLSSIGLTVEHWTAPGTPSRTRIGPQAGVGLEFALTKALFATLDGELGFIPGSPFTAEDLPEGFRLRSTWRRTLAAGLSLRL